MLWRPYQVLSLLAALSVAGPLKSCPAKLQFFGINESGAEFGEKNLPGVMGHDYTFPNTDAIGKFIDQGMNSFRVNVLMERLVPNDMTGQPDQAYMGELQKVVNYITDNGAYAMISPHNFGRYYGNVIEDTNGFQTFWQTVATPFADNPFVMFDTNNEFHDMDQSLVVNLNQAAINGIRASGATSQYITPEGNNFTGAWSWLDVNAETMGSLTDPSDKLIFHMHQYLDSDSSGTSDQCVNSTIGVDRLQGATQWLRETGNMALLGEFAGGPSSVCQEAVRGMLQFLNDNNDVWRGAMWWAGGPWWGNYMFSVEPSTGTAAKNYVRIFTKFY